MQIEITDTSFALEMDGLKLVGSITPIGNKRSGPLTIAVTGNFGSFKDLKAAKKVLRRAIDAGSNAAATYAPMLLAMTEKESRKVATPTTKAYNKVKAPRRSARK